MSFYRDDDSQMIEGTESQRWMQVLIGKYEDKFIVQVKS